jgi:serine kinase of HPr protein (carbohydrate metabolism regulator)
MGSTDDQPAEPDTSLAIHASAVVIGEIGILIRGPSGGGKSRLAMDLIFAARQIGRFASLIGDDRIDLDNRAGRLIARGHPLVRGMIEQRGLGILRVTYEAAAVVRLMVDIIAPQEAVRLPEPERTHAVLCGVQLPILPLLQGVASYDCTVTVLEYLERAGAV